MNAVNEKKYKPCHVVYPFPRPRSTSLSCGTTPRIASTSDLSSLCGGRSFFSTESTPETSRLDDVSSFGYSSDPDAAVAAVVGRVYRLMKSLDPGDLFEFELGFSVNFWSAR